MNQKSIVHMPWPKTDPMALPANRGPSSHKTTGLRFSVPWDQPSSTTDVHHQNRPTFVQSIVYAIGPSFEKKRTFKVSINRVTQLLEPHCPPFSYIYRI